MSAEVLNSEKAFSSGHNLWIVPDREHSNWAQKIDWYLQFQISKASIHKPYEPSEFLKNTLSQYDLISDDMNMPDRKSLLIFTSHALPNHQLVSIIFSKSNFKAWVQSIYEVWTNLKSPSLRVFLPKGVSEKEFTQNWPHKDSLSQISLVRDQ